MRDPAAMTSPGMVRRELRLRTEQGLQFGKDGIDEARWHGRHGHSGDHVASRTS
jgi:hypothetical protein